MKVNIKDKELKIKEIPKRFKRPNGIIIDGYDKLTDLHFSDGWRDIVIPEYDPELFFLGPLVLIQGIPTYEIIEKEELTNEENEILIKEKRENLLNKGITVSFNGFNIWFNEKYLSNFIVLKSELKLNNISVINWKDSSGIWREIPMSDADQISLIGMQLIQNIYLEN